MADLENQLLRTNVELESVRLQLAAATDEVIENSMIMAQQVNELSTLKKQLADSSQQSSQKDAVNHELSGIKMEAARLNDEVIALTDELSKVND